MRVDEDCLHLLPLSASKGGRTTTKQISHSGVPYEYGLLHRQLDRSPTHKVIGGFK